MSTYLSGPMSGLPNLNKPAFDRAAADLRAKGVEVVNPAEVVLWPGATWCDFMKADIGQMLKCDRVHMLPGWSNSKGARIERDLAKKLGLAIEYADERSPAVFAKSESTQ